MPNPAIQKGRAFLERINVLSAYRNPEPKFVPAQLLAHKLPLQRPLPLHTLQGYLNGNPVADRGQTHSWPHPEIVENAE